MARTIAAGAPCRQAHGRSSARRALLTGVTALVGAGLSTVGMVAVPVAPAAATTIDVDTTDDVVDGTDGVTSLREAVAAANANTADDTIVLSPGASYELTSCTDGPLTHTAAEALTVQGQGASVEQTCDDTGVFVSTDTSSTSLLTLVDLAINGGANTGVHLDGAAVFADGRLVLDGVTISGIDSGPGGTVVESSFGGGPGFVMSIVDTSITGSSGTAVSGDFVSATISGSTITGNVGSGVALVDGTPLVIEDSLIADNTGRAASTTGQGHTRMEVRTSTLTGNGLGGISCGACASLDVEETTIDGNGLASTAGTGGGIAFTFDYDPVPTDPGVRVLDSTITGNQAHRAGGGISVSTISPAFDSMTQPTIWIADTTVSGNQSIGDDVPGGGLSIRTGSVIVERTAIDDNEAGLGSAVPSRGGGLFVDETTDDGIADGRDMILNDTTFTGNSSAGSGGGAFLRLDGRMESADITFADNTSGSAGGGLFLATTDAGVDVARFTGNDAVRGGGLTGAALGGGGQLRFAGATFSGNEASDHGGGLNADDLDTLTLTNSTVTGNTATEGGGISVGVDPMDSPETVSLVHTTVAANTAVAGANVTTYEGLLRTEASVLVDGLGGSGCAVGPGNLDAVGFTFTDDAACAGAATDLVSAADPQVGPLADNGGPTMTMLPSAASPLGGFVPAASCAEPLDQRGVARPQGTGCEPGSVEITEVPSGPDELTGTGGSDLLVGSAADDLIRGLDGADILLGLDGDDDLRGGRGSDLLIGGDGIDALRGGPGIDLLFGSAGDVLDGGPGPDLCWLPGRILPRDC